MVLHVNRAFSKYTVRNFFTSSSWPEGRQLTCQIHVKSRHSWYSVQIHRLLVVRSCYDHVCELRWTIDIRESPRWPFNSCWTIMLNSSISVNKMWSERVVITFWVTNLSGASFACVPAVPLKTVASPPWQGMSCLASSAQCLFSPTSKTSAITLTGRWDISGLLKHELSLTFCLENCGASSSKYSFWGVSLFLLLMHSSLNIFWGYFVTWRLNQQ